MSPAPHTRQALPDHVLEAVTAGLDHRDDRGWIPWAWSVLARAQDVPEQIDEDHEDYPSHLVTLSGLSHLFDLFQDVVSGGDAGLETDPDLLGEHRPAITTIEIARYCERHGLVDTQWPETATGLLREAIQDKALELRRRLRDHLGDAGLFTSLHLAGRPLQSLEDEEGPAQRSLAISDESIDAHLHAAVNEDPTPQKQRAYAWLEGELDL